MADRVWAGGEQSTIPQLFARRLETDPDGEYLDVAGTKLSAGEVMAAADRFGGALDELGTEQHDRVATLLENSAPALLTWAGTVCAGRIAVPINTAYKGDVPDPPAGRLRLPRDRRGGQLPRPRVAAIAEDVPTLEHVIVVDDVDAGDDEDGAAAPAGASAVPSLGR